eukprot:CAMPEP_0117000994 /NCGR_PEP_ID=MMETSP0472-20121206/3147_1 /TAXON_ID=693140 ORGANISM="Tiarina fusus, Strain LIS" /NCGR_SAMPLE_ID=MMETSP0472 /ASSEMBLY_ACC=CAM_ASM_000603 /LENGTH=378 /DNA_ID=CAMNT_0004700865 /DNA_START=9 /DNA_END=1148 /DNA_ORIENTATION=+
MADKYFLVPGGARSSFIGARIGPTKQYEITGWLPTSDFGAVGNVWRALEHQADGKKFPVVVKTPKQPPTRSQVWNKELRGSEFAHDLPPHANLMTVMDVGEEPCPIEGRVGGSGQVVSYLVLEQCNEYDLFAFCETGAFPADLARHYFRQLLGALAFLHEHAGAHRDLKPDNIMLSQTLELKLGDFGFARNVQQGGALTQVGVGTPVYNPPEMGTGAVNAAAQDMWMAGVCLFIFLTGNFPFGGAELRESDRKRVFDRLDAPGEANPTHRGYWEGGSVGSFRPMMLRKKFLSEPAVDLLNRLWDRDPLRRLSAKQALEHPWLVKNDDGSPAIPFDMTAAVMEALRGGAAPQRGQGLLGELCARKRDLFGILQRDNSHR